MYTNLIKKGKLKMFLFAFFFVSAIFLCPMAYSEILLDFENSLNESSTGGFFREYETGKSHGPSYQLTEIVQNGAIGTNYSFKDTVVYCDPENPEQCHNGNVNVIYHANATHKVFIPQAKGANRLVLFVKLPEGYPLSADNNFHVGTYTRQPREEPIYSDGNHYYHFFNIPGTGNWSKIICNEHPQHEVGVRVDPGNNPETWDYYEGFTRFYFMASAESPIPLPYSAYIDEVEFYSDSEPENDETINSLSCSYFGDGHFQIGWHGNSNYDHNGHQYEVRYSTSPITNDNYTSATVCHESPYSKESARGVYNFIKADFTISVQDNTCYYFAIKDLDSDIPYVTKIDYLVGDVLQGNQQPVANAGPNQQITDSDDNGSETVTLDGSASYDSDGTIASYIWKEDGVDIANGANPTVSLSVGSHNISLIVTDNEGAEDTDTVVITVVINIGNQPPIANAGQDQNVADVDNDGTEQVMLDGSNSSDPDGTIVSYIWKENGVDIANGANPTVNLSVGSHNISLIVTDNEGAEDTDTVVITIYPYSIPSETKINFQPPGAAPTPSEYMADEGFVFDQTRGYGWDGDISAQSRDRDINPDQRLDTFIFADGRVKTWELELPNGQYLVSLSVGDAEVARGNHKVILEGEEIINGSTLANQYITVEDHSLTVSDGKLTMQAGGGNPIGGGDPWGLTNLNYIIIKSVSSSALPPPDSLSAQSTYSIELSWSSVTGAVGYNVYRSTTQGTGYVKINSYPVTGTSYLDENTTPGVTYYYVVTSLNSDGVEGSYSPEASCTEPLAPPANQPPQITGFTAIPTSLNNPGESTTFNVSATDPDGDSLTYTINFGDGTANGSGSQVVHTYEAGAGEPPHIYTATVTVSDGHGHSVGQSLQVTVNDIPPAEPTNVSAD